MAECQDYPSRSLNVGLWWGEARNRRRGFERGDGDFLEGLLYFIYL
jgi:hypothetical protein